LVDIYIYIKKIDFVVFFFYLAIPISLPRLRVLYVNPN
jgi:hypothetical protein